MLRTEAEPQRTNGKRMQAQATLIATGAPAGAITEILCAEGLKTIAFEQLEDLPDRRDPPSVAVLWAQDISSSASLGRAIGGLRQRSEAAPVIVVCDGIERWGIRAALTTGAAGIVLYDELQRALVPCLRAVLAGQTCVPRAHSRQIEPPALSARERQILGLVVMGYMNSQIAKRLYLAESTVKSHLSSAFGKLGVRSRNEAVKLIVNPDSGLGLGILGLVGEGEPTTSRPAAAR